MKLLAITRPATRDAFLSGNLGRYEAAPGWPHDDTEPGLSFLDTGGSVFLVIDDDGRIAGECGTKTPPRADGAVEIGYGLAAPSRGRGLGQAAVGELVAWLARWPEVTRIEAEVHVANQPSWRILERLGFVPTGIELSGYRRYALDVSD